MGAVPLTAAPHPTPERLLDAAESLFGDAGVDAVSVRAVNAAAGANVAAVHYHFGSKDALIEAVLRRRMDAIGERRLGMLAGLPTRPNVRAVVEALVVPLAEFGADPDGGGRPYVRFLASLQSSRSDTLALRSSAFAPQLGPLDEALARALPALPAPVRQFRLELAGRMVVQTLAHAERAAAALGVPERDGHGVVVAALLDAVAGMFTAPLSPPTEGPRP
jgi:AcrR family transcriptional regulator